MRERWEEEERRGLGKKLEDGARKSQLTFFIPRRPKGMWMCALCVDGRVLDSWQQSKPTRRPNKEDRRAEPVKLD